MIDANDEKVIGKGTFPDLNFGLTLAADWKGFDVNILFQGASNYTQVLNALTTLSVDRAREMVSVYGWIVGIRRIIMIRIVSGYRANSPLYVLRVMIITRKNPPIGRLMRTMFA